MQAVTSARPSAVRTRSPRAFARHVAGEGLPAAASTPPVTEADLAGLPHAAARYLRAMGAVGRPRTWSFRAHLAGRLRLGPGRPWMACDAWQYNSSVEVARLCRLRLMMGGAVPMWGWDTYRSGTGRMHGKLLGLVTVADGTGPQFDVSELTTWLDDAVLMAPGMLLHPRATWTAVDDDSFRVSITDAGHTVTAQVFLDDDGRPRDVRSDDRWADLPGGLVRATWSTPVDGWTETGDGPRLTGGAAVWLLPDGEFRYAELRQVELRPDVPPWW